MPGVCSYSMYDLGLTDLIKFKIELKPNTEPIATPYRGVKQKWKEKVKSLIVEMLDSKLIRRSKSPWRSQLVVALKSNGEPRLCVDYSPNNDKTVKFAGPIPRINEQIFSLMGATIFTKLDLAGAFHQVKIEDE